MELVKAVHTSKMRLNEYFSSLFREKVGLSIGTAGGYVSGKTLTVFAIVTVPKGASLSDVAAEARAPVLKVLGVLSYWFDAPLDIQMFTSGQSSFDLQTVAELEARLEGLHQVDYLENHYVAQRLIDLQGRDSKRAHALWTMLENYRRGLALFREYEDWFSPEAILAFFKIPELLASLYVRQLRERTNEAARRLVRQFLGDSFDEGLPLDRALQENDARAERLVIELLTGRDTLTQRRQILFALRQIDLDGLRLRHYVGEIVKLRNRLAHANPISFSRWEFPLPPYLVGPEESQNLGQFSKALARNIIARMLGVSENLTLTHSVAQALSDLPPTPQEVEVFLESHTPLDVAEQFFEIDQDYIDYSFPMHMDLRGVEPPVGFDVRDLLTAPDNDLRIVPFLEKGLSSNISATSRSLLLTELLVRTRNEPPSEQQHLRGKLETLLNSGEVSRPYIFHILDPILRRRGLSCSSRVVGRGTNYLEVKVEVSEMEE